MIITGDKSYYDIQLAYNKLRMGETHLKETRPQENTADLRCCDESQRHEQDSEGFGGFPGFSNESPERVPFMGIRQAAE